MLLENSRRLKEKLRWSSFDMYTIQAVVVCYNCNKKYFPSREGTASTTDGCTFCPFCDSINNIIVKELEYLEIYAT